jgi:fumarate hydratase subunit alpha
MKIKKISTEKIIETIKNLCMETNFNLGRDVLNAFDKAIETEVSPLAKGIFTEIKENAKISGEDQVPLCQDCGTAVVFIDIGQDVHITGGDLREAVNAGVRLGYENGYLRKSVCHPLSRKNTGDNTPAIIHYEIVPGNNLKITLAPKGGGSENMSRIKMLTPASGIEGIKEFVINTVKEAGGNPCPPVILGIGIGGNFERSALLAKRALLREIGTRNQDRELAKIEEDILESVNRLGIGPMGYGGSNTCLDVFIEMEPCHIASLPAAVNINCHSARHKQAIL